MALWTVPPIWKDGECWILGGGTSLPREFGVPEEIVRSVMDGAPPSVYVPYLEPLRSRHVIGINNVYKIGDLIDVLFFGDCSWYASHKNYIYPLSCLKVTCCDRFAKADNLCEGIKYLAKDKNKTLGLSDNPSAVCWNYNSGCAAMSMAAHLGVRRIILLGFDMTLDSGKVSHWHGSHMVSPGKIKAKPRVPPFQRHLKGITQIAADARARGIEILNASPISVIDAFPKVRAMDIINEKKAVNL